MSAIQQDGIITIGITSYNYGHFIGEAVDSVINQTSPNWKLMIYDNGSTDNTFEVLEPYLADPRVTLIVHEENIGARNNSIYAIRHADTQFFSFLQADDFLDHTFVENALFQFGKYPESPFVFFNWQQFLQQTQTAHEHKRFPFAADRSGPIYIAPFLTIFNFVPLHMAAFRTECLQYAYEALLESPLKQVGEQFILKLLEDKYGLGCYTGTMGGVWRRHDEQMTATHVQSNVAFLEEPVERLWYIKKAVDPKTVNIFMALATSMLQMAQGSLLSVADWLTHTEGQRYAESYGISVEQEKDRIKRMVLVVVLKVATFGVISLFNDGELENWVKSLGAEFNRESLTKLLLEIKESEGETLLNRNEIEQICQFCFDGENITSLSYTSEKVRDILFSRVLPIHTQTGMPLLAIAISMLDNNKEQLASQEEKELFLLSACKTAFDAITRRSQHSISKIDKAELADLLAVLHDQNRIEHEKNSAFELRKEIFDWQRHFDYQRWITNHALLEIDAEIHAERMMQWVKQPQFHLYMFLFEGEETLLANTLDSLSSQFYPNWKLTIIADTPAPDPMFEELAVLDWVIFPAGADPYAYLNQLMFASVADWLMFIPAGTTFEPHTFLVLGDYINLYPDKKLFYSDDDIIDIDGERSSPRFKPDFNLDLLRSSDYIGLVLCETSTFIGLGGYEVLPSFESYGLALRGYEGLGHDAFMHISDVLMHLPDGIQAHQGQSMLQQAVLLHLKRLNIAANIEPGLIEQSNRVEYLWAEIPMVSIVIPTKDKIEFFRPCVESLLKKTTYPKYEVLIVDNQSQDPDILRYFDDLAETHAGKVRVLSYSKPFNYADISNMAASQANGDYLLFLNNDTEILHAEWLQRMINHGLRPEVGVVGARLVLPETGFIQHAGVVLGMDTIADHVYIGELDMQEPGYMGRAQLDQNYSAVTGACLLIRKSIYDAVGGMDSEQFAVSYNDIDLCLKVSQLGYLVTWTPYAVLVHHGSITQLSEINNNSADKSARFNAEREHMLNKWSALIANDPAFNRHLSLAHRDVRIESEMPCNWDVNFNDRTKVLGLPLSGGSGDYRVVQPFDAISHAAIAQCEYYRFSNNETRRLMISEYARLAPDVAVFQAAVNDVQLQQIEDVSKYLPDVKKVYTIDDLLTNVPEYSPAYQSTRRYFANAKERLRRALGACDRLIVSTQPLADLCQDMIDDIRVIPNRLTVQQWGDLVPAINDGEKLRVGWAGAQQHQGDLAIITEVVKETAEIVDWVFMGMCPDEVRPYLKEFHNFVAIEAYPEKLASLALDLAIAPLEVNEFNEAKSNLRLLEYGIMGWPVICTDIYPYQTNNPPVIKVPNEKQAWLDAIYEAIADVEQLRNAGQALRNWVIKDYILEDHLDDWSEALFIEKLPTNT